MGLFVQKITLNLSNSENLVEKVALPEIGKGKVDLQVMPGTIAIVGSTKFKGQNEPYKITSEILGPKKTALEAYLVPDKPFDAITVKFFGGQHMVSLSSLTKVKAKFSIVGDALVEIADYKDLANYFKKSVTRKDLIDEINANFRSHLTNEVSAAASKFITPETTEVTLNAALSEVAQEVMKSRKTASFLMEMGLILSNKGLSMKLNALDDAENAIATINDALTQKALDSLNDDILDRQEKERQAERQHEIDKIKAQNSDYHETTENRNINTSGNGNVTINNNSGANAGNTAVKSFCPSCGEKISNTGARFCPFCGAKL